MPYQCYLKNDLIKSPDCIYENATNPTGTLCQHDLWNLTRYSLKIHLYPSS